MQLDLFKLPLSRTPQGDRVGMSAPAITCARASRPGTLNGNACTTRTVRTFLRHECHAHFIVGRPPPGLNYQCREAKHIPRFYQTRPPQLA